MIDYIYDMDQSTWKDYNPLTQEINKDVLRLGICAEFSLDVLRGKLIEQLVLNRAALQEVAHSPQIMKFPELMQALLQQTAASGKRESESALVLAPAAKKLKNSPEKPGRGRGRGRGRG